MQNKPAKSLDQIKPFLRMLEGSIDDARRRRLGHDQAPGPVAAPNAAALRNGAPPPPARPAPAAGPIPMPGSVTAPPTAAPEPADRPLRATPIKPKQTLHPSTGFRPTGS